MATVLEQPRSTEAGFAGVPLTGLAADEPLTFPLYLRTGEQTVVLYRPASALLDASHIGRLQAEGIAEFCIRWADRPLYLDRASAALETILRDRDVPLSARAEVLVGVAVKMADELLGSPLDAAGIKRANKVMMSTSGLLLREDKGFAAIRRLMTADTGLAQHSLTVSFLGMGLARFVLGSDANGLMLAGLAGLLHDVGRIDHDDVAADHEHAARGADYLAGLGVPAAVVQAVRSHHERHDGSGHPDGLAGEQIPALARVVGVCDAFDRVYSGQSPRVGVFDALRLLALAYRGCFDDKLAAGLVRLFR